MRITPFSTLLMCATGMVAGALLPSPVHAQEVAYSVSMPRPTSSLLHVEMEIRDANADAEGGIEIAMPAWSPGAYRIHSAAKNVTELIAHDGQGAVLRARMNGTSSWRIEPAAPVIRIAYKVYVGNSALNDRHAAINGTRTLMYVVGTAPYPAPGPVSLRVDSPPGWRIATGLTATSPGLFSAPDYDTLIDAPVEVSPELEVVTFDLDGVTFEIVVHARHNYDLNRLRDSIRPLVAEQVRMMGGAPFSRYVFLFHGSNRRGSGGLEHLNSTTISFSRYASDDEALYRRFEFVIAHEFFHLWNVKRIRPEILGPFDYSRPQHTRNLYVSEGMTSYYASLSLARSAVWERQHFYEDLARNIDELQEQPGHLLTSAEMSSWLTWNRPDDAADVSISYYTKGQILGTLLDLELRARTGNRQSLDDVFRHLMATHGLPKPGFDEQRGFQDAVELIAVEAGASGNFNDFFGRYVSGLEEIPYDEFLGHVGLQLEIEPGEPHRSIGVAVGTRDGRISVGNVPPTGAGFDAGLMPGDVILALDGEQIAGAEFAARIDDRAAGDVAELTVMRGDRMLTLSVVLQEEQERTYRITEDPEASQSARELRESWLGPQQR